MTHHLHQLRGKSGPMLAFLDGLPLKLTWVITAACLIIGEQYPLSNFPMFASFSNKTYYLYLADQEDRPLPALQFRIPTNGIKKAFEANVQKLRSTLPKRRKLTPEENTQAARATLDYLVAERSVVPPGVTAVRLVRVDVTVAGAELKKTPSTIGEVTIR